MSTEKCGSPAVDGPCALSAGHNMGRVDIPQNHRATGPSTWRDSEENLRLLLQHYFGLFAKECGIRWDSDYVAEIDLMVDCIVRLARST